MRKNRSNKISELRDIKEKNFINIRIKFKHFKNLWVKYEFFLKQGKLKDLKNFILNMRRETVKRV